MQDYFDALLHSSVFGVFIYQENGQIVFANKRFCDILGFESESELIGKSILEFLTAEEQKEIEPIIRRRLADERFRFELNNHYYKTKSSSLIPVSTFSYTIDYNNKPSGLVLVLDRRKEISNQKLFFALSQINQLIVRVDNEDELLRETVNILVDKVGYIACAAGYIDKDNLFRQIYTKANTQELEQALSSLTIGTDPNTPYGKGTVSRAYHTKKVSLISNMDKMPYTSYWHSYLKTFNVNSACTIPILKFGKVEYIILIHDSTPDTFSEDHMHLLEEISLDLSFALEKIEKDHFSNLITTAINNGFDFVIVTDDKFNIVYVNDRVLETTGYTKDELIGKNHSIFVYCEEPKEFYDMLTSGKAYSGVIKYKIKDGSLKDFIVNILPYTKKDKITNYIVTGKEVKDQDKLLEELEKALNYDSLTNLLNLNGFRGSVKRFIKRASYEKQLGALFIMNPIGFKSINEAYGFEIGNKVLVLIASRLRSFFRAYDVIAKLESDRFGVLAKDFRSEEDIVALASRLMLELSKPYIVSEDKIQLSFSIGISFFPKDALNTQELFDKAYIALSDAKQKGENQIGFFNKDIQEQTMKKFKVLSELSLAVSNKSFVAFYQPYVDRYKNISGAEALMRLVRNGQIVPPVEFIETLEKSPYIIDAEDIILNQVFDDIEHYKPKVPISINLSLKSLLKRNLVQYISSQLHHRGLPSSNILNIEIIERSLIESFDYIKRLIEEFKGLNIHFSLDDFGTGYSSLSYLSKLKVEFLKIDISFVRKLDDPETKKIVKAIITISKELSIKTIAEGVETPKQFEELSSLGCDYFQGFLFYKPMAREEFFELVRKHKV